MKTVSSQECKFVGILAHGRYTDMRRAVEVQMGEFVGQPLELKRK